MSTGKVLKKILPEKIFKRLLGVYTQVKLHGDTYHCPICKRSYSAFYSAGFDFPVLKELDVVGGGFRKNVRCPGCNSGDRERLFFLYLKNVLKVDTERLSILHVAPEESVQLYLKSLTNISHESIDLGSERADKKMDIQSLQYPSDTFDVVICNHVLEHIIDDGLAMREMYRVLRKGGTAILQVPISLKLAETFEDPAVVSHEDRERVFGQSDHVRIYARDYKERLEKSGFSVQVVPYAKVLGNELSTKYALNAREDLYICRK